MEGDLFCCPKENKAIGYTSVRFLEKIWFSKSCS